MNQNESFAALLAHCAEQIDCGSQEPTSFKGLSVAHVQLMIASIFSAEKRSNRKVVIVFPESKEPAQWKQFAIALQNERTALGQKLDLGVLPFFRLWGNERLSSPWELLRQRMDALNMLRSNQDALIFTSLTALYQMTLAVQSFDQARLLVRRGDEFDIEKFARCLKTMGYLERRTVEEQGQFAVRGGIVDVFSPGANLPYRLELFGDQVAAVRSFSLETQKSVFECDEVWVGPAMEMVFDEAKKDVHAQTIYEYLLDQNVKSHDRDGLIRSFLAGDHFNDLSLVLPLIREKSQPSWAYCGKNTLFLFPASVEACVEEAKQEMRQFLRQYEKDLLQQKLTVSPKLHYDLSSLEQSPLKFDQSMIECGGGISWPNFAVREILTEKIEFPISSSSGKDAFGEWVKFIETAPEKKISLTILSPSEDQRKRISLLFANRGLRFREVDVSLSETLRAENSSSLNLVLGIGEIANPVWVEPARTLLVPESYIVGRSKRKQASTSKRLQNFLTSFRQLKLGNLVVHVDHGIGRYLGITTLRVQGIQSDCLQIEYAGGDKIYLPVEKLNLLQKYSSGSEDALSAPLDKLQGQSWQKRKSKVRKELRDMAEQLLKNQAQRELAKGLRFVEPGEDYYKFEAEFPFYETEDQARAIAEVNSDLARDRLMDRLICGDVGFGKTEVALRAAYRTVLEGAQVLVLVPTTVLSFQHFRTFSGRMSRHGVRVAMVNRFVKGLALKEAIHGLKEGRIDVLVGTHRLLSKDIKPKKLGLLVVDEEQRFGVSHKESLKALKGATHILTLTATPIPRTLNMALAGLRDISLITTPPPNRLAIKTYISRFDPLLLQEAIRQEVQRGGQVFIVHNRVDDIVELKNKIKALLPEVDIRVAHGQMHEETLENVIVDFIEQKFQVLLCTTIIESGIDMPNVNTLIINNAHRFGLAQLYQLRGRVGRSSRQAFAYLFVPSDDLLTDEARQRLDVLSQFQELGSGFQIASQDLEIRGAGNLLGAEQSGKIEEVGFELYMKMLEQAVAELKGQTLDGGLDPEIKIRFSAFVPVNFMPDEGNRLEIYKKLFSAEARSDFIEIRAEIRDRFGGLPPEVELLCDLGELKYLLRASRIGHLSIASFGEVECRFASLSAAQIEKVSHLVHNKSGLFRLTSDFKLRFSCSQQWSTDLKSQKIYMKQILANLELLAVEMEAT